MNKLQVAFVIRILFNIIATRLEFRTKILMQSSVQQKEL